MKEKLFWVLALIPLLSGCALFGTKDKYIVTPQVFRLEDLIAEHHRQKTGEEKLEQRIREIGPTGWAGTYLLKVNTLSGGDNYTAGNCDESALVKVDENRKITNIKPFPSSAKTCGTEESLKLAFWGKVVPAFLLSSAQVAGSALYGSSLPKNVGDRLHIENDNDLEQNQEGLGGAGGAGGTGQGGAGGKGYGGQGGHGGTGGGAKIEKGAVSPTIVNNNKPVNQGGSVGNVSGGSSSIQNSGNATVKGSGNSSATGGSSKAITGPQTTDVKAILTQDQKVGQTQPCGWCGHGK